jgi:flagellar protein FliL
MPRHRHSVRRGLPGKFCRFAAPLQPIVNPTAAIVRRRFAAFLTPLYPSSIPMATATATEEIETAPAEGEAAAEAKTGGKKKLIMIAGGAVGLLLVAAAGLYFTGMLDSLLGNKHAAVAEAPPPKPLVFFDLPDFLVNLNSNGAKKASFLKLSVSLELEKQEDTARLQAVMPRIVDNFQIYLRELRVDDLRGSGGIYRLREELLARVNAAVAPVKVNDVLFKEMLVQ